MINSSYSVVYNKDLERFEITHEKNKKKSATYITKTMIQDTAFFSMFLERLLNNG